MKEYLRMIIKHWSEEFKKLYGGSWPRTYLCLDIEYTGFNPHKAVIMEFGHTLVEDGKKVDEVNFVLNWAGHPIVPERWLRGIFERQHDEMGSDWKFDWAMMVEEGLPANDVLETYYELLGNWQAQGHPIVMHNGVNRDSEMLEGNFVGILSKDFKFHPNAIIDTGALVKASRALEMGIDPMATKKQWLLPHVGDSLRDYFKRVTQYPAKGVKWKMSAAMEWLGLDVRHNLDLTGCHRAGYDSYLCYLLMEEFRRQLEGGPGHNYLKSQAMQREAEKPQPMRGTVLESSLELDPTASVENFAQMFDEELGKPKQPAVVGKPPAPAPITRRRQRAV